MAGSIASLQTPRLICIQILQPGFGVINIAHMSKLGTRFQLHRLKTGIILLFIITCSLYALEPNVYLHGIWKAARVSEIKEDGSTISLNGFTTGKWIDSRVPGTVLTALVDNGIYPDPYFGLNNQKIPDISDIGPEFYTFWFRREFTIPDSLKGKRIWLTFRGINYTADIYLNGSPVAMACKGMFIRRTFEITHLIDSRNILAVRVAPPDYPGRPGGNGGDGTIAKSVTMQYTVGWDWIPPIRDRNTGIWDQVYLSASGPVVLKDTYVKTDLPLPDTLTARLTLSTCLVNKSKKAVSGTLVSSLANITISKQVILGPGDSIITGFSPDSFSQLILQKPHLWWPAGMGKQEMYSLQMEFRTSDSVVSDKSTTQFGIREFSYEKRPNLVLRVNGQRVFCAGGNWIGTDAMLRLSAQRYDDEVRLHRDMNLNMIRVWGGGLIERPEFYEACDRYGIMVMQDFPITSNCNGGYGGSRKYPLDKKLFLESASDAIRMLRNHPSLSFWCGGNEIKPPIEIDSVLKHHLIPDLDGTRLYQSESANEGLGGHGPYGFMTPQKYYHKNAKGFTSELGSYAALPNVESMVQMMDSTAFWPPSNKTWKYHHTFGVSPDYQKSTMRLSPADNIADYCRNAQIVNYSSSRSLYESWLSKMWKCTSGVLAWKSQSPWPHLIWQFYDWYLEPTAGYYGVKKACEPRHIMLDENTRMVYFVNRTAQAIKGLHVKVVTQSLDMSEFAEMCFERKFDSPADTVIALGTVPEKKLKSKNLLILKAMNSDTLLSKNIYWTKGLNSFEKLPRADIHVNYNSVSADTGAYRSVTVRNSGPGTALFVRLQLIDPERKLRILPLFFSDNYLIILPGETDTVRFNLSDIKVPKQMSLRITGINFIHREIIISDN